jgi:MurNAc alpha-1-phosphate uridylyltransferase
MATAPKTAMVMAAGLGTRMRPLTDDRPKALVEVGGKALIDHMLDRLVEAGVETAVVNVHYFADLVEAHLARRAAPHIVISDEREALLETGGGLRKARPLLGEDPIFVANIDAVWTEDAGSVLAGLAAAWDSDAMDALLLVAPMPRTLGFDGPGDFFMDDAGRLAFRGDAPASPFAFAGVHITKPQVVDDQPVESFSLRRIWRPMAQAGRMHAFALAGEWMHVGDPQALVEAEKALGDGTR